MMTRLLFDICSTCGNEVVGDNTGDGREWTHLVGPEREHHVTFGTMAGQEFIDSLLARRHEIDDEAQALADTVFPEPGEPRDLLEEDLGNGRSGRRQLVNAAEKAGLHWRGTYCVGPVADQWGRYSHHVRSICLALYADDGRHALVIFEAKVDDEKWATKAAFIRDSGRGIVGVADVKEWLRG